MSVYGGVAQLGERTVRIRKVESSILFVSTKKHPTHHWCVGCFSVVDTIYRTLRKSIRLFTWF